MLREKSTTEDLFERARKAFFGAGETTPKPNALPIFAKRRNKARKEQLGIRSADAAVHALDPLNDPRWSALIAEHPRASVFHTRGWLEALRRTYGFKPE